MKQRGTDHAHVAAADCERCRPGLIAQPVNTVSSLAFCAAGLVIVARNRRKRPDADRTETNVTSPRASEVALGWSAVAAGLGSVAYHGPGTRAGQIFHDASLITMLGALVAADSERVTGHVVPRPCAAALPIAATLVAASRWSLGAQVATGLAAGVAEVARIRHTPAASRRPWRPVTEGAVAAVGAVGHLLGRTGGPLCRPDSPWQSHAAWHTAMATVLVARD